MPHSMNSYLMGQLLAGLYACLLLRQHHFPRYATFSLDWQVLVASIAMTVYILCGQGLQHVSASLARQHNHDGCRSQG